MSYVPLDEYVREAYIAARESDVGVVSSEYGDEFDRWLAAHDREVAAEAWDEGFTRGFYSGQSMRSDADASESPVENPYAAEREGAGEGVLDD